MTLFQRAVARVERGLAHRAFPLVSAAIAVALVLPALRGGFQLDDVFHRMRLLGYGEPSINLFVFFDGDPAKTATAMDQGWLPWWTAPNLRHASLRYLSVLTMQVDYLLWPHRPELMHLHSLLWLGALVAAAALLYRRILGPTWVAGLAALLYAVDEAHAAPAAYLANRNALIATCLGVLCLLCFARWRQEGWGPGAVLGPLCLAAALAAGEMALATAGYLAAYAAFLDRAPVARRLRSLIPNAVVLAAWAAVYKLGHFGVSGSGFYIDPAGEPLAFARVFFDRALLLLLGQWTPIRSDFGSFYAAGSVHALRLRLVALLFLLLLAMLLRPLLRDDRVARFWCAGAIFSLLPIAAVGPQNRLLFFVGLGSMALLAQLAHRLDRGAAERREAGVVRAATMLFAGLLLFVHLVLAPFATPFAAAAERRLGERMTAAIASVPGDQAVAAQDLVLVNPPEHVYFVTSIVVVKPLAGQPIPRHLRALANGKSPMRATRRDATTLDLELDSGLFPDPFSRYFRSDDQPLERGQRIQLTGFSAEVLEVDAGGDPVLIRYRFDRPLEDPGLRWLAWEGGRYVAWTPPPVGATARLLPIGDPL